MEELGATEDDIRVELMKSPSQEVSEKVRESAKIIVTKEDGQSKDASTSNIFQLSAG